jgi:alpha-1,2-mannosyltransferase
VKLTPAVFLLYLAAGRQWRAVGNAVAAFATVTALAALVHPAQSRAYWFELLWQPERIGGLAYAGNQSVRGALHRLGFATDTELICWAVAVVLILVLGGFTAVRWRAGPEAAGRDSAGRDATALIVVALVGLLLSPVSWSHHWVWLVPTLMVLGHLALQRRSTLLAVTTGLVVVGMLVPAHRLLPHSDQRELDWSAWQHGLGNSYLWLGLLLLGVLLALPRAARPRLAHTPHPVT